MSFGVPFLGGLAGALPVPALFQRRTPVPAHVVVGERADCLRRVVRPGINLAIWLRSADRGADRAPASALGRRAVAVDETVSVGDGWGRRLVPDTLPTSLASIVARDIDRLSRLLCRLQPTTRVRVKLSTCDGDECRLFHVDHIPLRFITTYLGPGTDWLENDAARREHLGGRGLPRGTPITSLNNAIVADWTRVHRLPRFAVAAFRGSQPLPGRPRSDVLGVVHRSPPIAGTGIVRLRLVVEVAGGDHGACDTADACAG